MSVRGKEKRLSGRDKNFNTRPQNATNLKYVFCDGTRHRISDCTEVKDRIFQTEDRKIMSSKKLCFNCLKYENRAADCPGITCFKCNRKHHTSLCINNHKTTSATNIKRQKKRWWLHLEKRAFTIPYCPIVILNASGILCRTLADTETGSSYDSATLINCIGTSSYILQSS